MKTSCIFNSCARNGRGHTPTRNVPETPHGHPTGTPTTKLDFSANQSGKNVPANMSGHTRAHVAGCTCPFFRTPKGCGNGHTKGTPHRSHQ